MRLDDIFCGLSLATLLATYIVFSLGPNGSTSDAVLLLKLAVAYQLLRWTTLYLVKASFLALCWHVFNVSETFRKAWWIVVGYTFLSYWPVILNFFWICGDPSKYADPPSCTDLLTTGLGVNAYSSLIICLTLHTSSELLILALPLPWIKRLQMSTARKWSVTAIFAIVIVDIIMGVIRLSATLCMVLNYHFETSSTVANIAQNCEISIAVMVCALPAYGILLKSSRHRDSAPSRMQRHFGSKERTILRRSESTQGTAPHSPRMQQTDSPDFI